MSDYNIGVIIGVVITGTLTGAVPAITGAVKGKIGLAIGGFFACFVSAVILGLILAVPVCALFMYFICRKPKNAENVNPQYYNGQSAYLSGNDPTPLNQADILPSQAQGKFCPSCGKAANAYDAFCQGCGTKFQ